MRRLLLIGLIAAAATAWSPQRAQASWLPQRYVVVRKETLEDSTRRVERVVAIALAVGLGVCALIALIHFIRDTLQALEAARHSRQPWDDGE